MQKVSSKTRWALWGVVVLYLVLCGLFYTPIEAPYKLVYPLGLLTIASLWERKPLLTLALGLSALGDFMGASGELLLQIGAFAAAQVCYLLLIGRCVPKRSVREVAMAASLPVVLSVVAIVAILPTVGVGAVKVGVIIYALLIGTMATLAALTRSWQVRIGAMLFMLSDFTLAYAIFVAPTPPLLDGSLVLYFAGQLLLWLGLLRR